jgi:hypothetical protein
MFGIVLIMMSDQFHVHNKEFFKCSFPMDLSLCNMHMKVLISTTHFLLCSTINETHINFKIGTMMIWSLQQMTENHSLFYFTNFQLFFWVDFGFKLT